MGKEFRDDLRQGLIRSVVYIMRGSKRRQGPRNDHRKMVQ